MSSKPQYRKTSQLFHRKVSFCYSRVACQQGAPSFGSVPISEVSQVLNSKHKIENNLQSVWAGRKNRARQLTGTDES